ASVTSMGGFNSPVGFGVTGLPTGASASFSPNTVTGTGTTSLILNTASSTPAGLYTLNATGTGGNISHTASVTVSVNATSTQPPAVSVSPTQGSGASQVFSVTVTDSVAAGNVDWTEM